MYKTDLSLWSYVTAAILLYWYMEKKDMFSLMTPAAITILLKKITDTPMNNKKKTLKLHCLKA